MNRDSKGRFAKKLDFEFVVGRKYKTANGGWAVLRGTDRSSVPYFFLHQDNVRRWHLSSGVCLLNMMDGSKTPYDIIGPWEEPAETATTAPSHYTTESGENYIDTIKELLGRDAFNGFCLGNALKYMKRAGEKPGEPAVKDYKKALDYLLWHIGPLPDSVKQELRKLGKGKV